MIGKKKSTSGSKRELLHAEKPGKDFDADVFADTLATKITAMIEAERERRGGQALSALAVSDDSAGKRHGG